MGYKIDFSGFQVLLICDEVLQMEQNDIRVAWCLHNLIVMVKTTFLQPLSIKYQLQI